MDSGNSGGSLQSSSGGDDEYYDSRAAVDSAFMSGGPPAFFIPNTTISPPPFNPQPTNNNNFQRPPPTTMGQLDTSGPPPLQNHARNPKKRSRASRRAPTTVLTTDTANFRVMVQEFTGIPAPPFSSSPRLDLFGTRSAVNSPTYLRRPFAQKVQPPPLPSCLVPSSSLMSTNNVNNYQLPIAQSSSNLFRNIQNPILSSLLQSANPKFPFSDVNLTRASDDHSQQKIGVLDEQFLRNLSGQGNNNLHLHHHHHHASSAMPSGLPNLTTSDQIRLQNDHNDSNNAANWRGNRVVPTGDKEDDRIISMRPLNGGNYISSTSDFQGGKEPENATGAAAVESWICPSE